MRDLNDDRLRLSIFNHFNFYDWLCRQIQIAIPNKPARKHEYNSLELLRFPYLLVGVPKPRSTL